MTNDYTEIGLRLALALALGGIIGIERSYRGRAAGFRTHALVSLASGLLMLISAYGAAWFPLEAANLDPTRVAQGIMTGIGFVGAGAIIKEGLIVRGLTTAASIWVTAVIGILAGIGFFAAALIGTVLTLGTLSLFGWIESKMITEYYARLVVRFPREAPMNETGLRELVAGYGFAVRGASYRLVGEDQQFEYRLLLRTFRAESMGRLSEALRHDPAIREFRVMPISE
jgi:putative Mg2+ transporter-C (MgtC) family protein